MVSRHRHHTEHLLEKWGYVQLPQQLQRHLLVLALLSFAPRLASATLVAHWAMDEGTGTTVADDSGMNATGTLAGSNLPTWVPGKVGPYALSFTGTSSYVSTVNATNLLVGAQHYSAATWVKTTGTSIMVVTGFYDAASTGDYWYLALNWPTSGKFSCYTRNPGLIPANTAWIQTTNTVSIFDGAWHHIACVVNVTAPAASGVMYVDGAAVAATVPVNNDEYGTLQAFRLNLFIGAEAQNSTPAYGFVGGLDDLRIYRNALTSGDVATLYAMGNAPWLS